MILTLYHSPMSRSTTARWMLEEVGEPYKLEIAITDSEQPRTPNHLAINPLGKVPALNHDGTFVTETAAICAYLADAFPASKLAPSPDSKERGIYYRWLFFTAAAFEPAMIDKGLKRDPGPKTMMPYGDFESVVDVTAAAVAKGPYLLGNAFSAADVVLGSNIRWTMMFEICPKRQELTDYIERLEKRPALQKQLELDQALIKQKS